MYTKFGKKPRFTSAAVVMVVTMLLATTAISTVLTSENAYAYSNNQAKSDINNCGNGELPLNIGCQNTDSQIQGDDNTATLASQQRLPIEEVCPEGTVWDITLQEAFQSIPTGTVLCLPDGLGFNDATISGTDDTIEVNVSTPPPAAIGCEFSSDARAATTTSGNPPCGVMIGETVCVQEPV